MNIAMLPRVNMLVIERRQLLYHLRGVEQPGFLRITLDAHPQEDDIIEMVRPVVAAELRSKIARIDADLYELGVEVEPIADHSSSTPGS